MNLGRGYRPIEDYAAIGDCHGGALVARDGGIDWCCLDRFDADPVFCRLLDDAKGGFLATTPTTPFVVSRAYLDGTNILRTEMRSDRGRLAVTDFMPVGRAPSAGLYDYVSLVAPGSLVRQIEIVEGAVEIAVEYRPSVRFGAQAARLRRVPGGIGVEDGPTLLSDLGLVIADGGAAGRFRLAAGDRRFLILGRDASAAALDEALVVTSAFWREWIAFCRYRGPYADAVRRSALALKLLTFAPSGASVAALTTSLPEELGGSRNWDYRFCWIRDASLMLHALAFLGYSGEARRFYEFIHRAVAKGPLQVLYGVHGDVALRGRGVGKVYEDLRPACRLRRRRDRHGRNQYHHALHAFPTSPRRGQPATALEGDGRSGPARRT